MHRHEPSLKTFIKTRPLPSGSGLPVVRYRCRQCGCLLQMPDGIRRAYELAEIFCRVLCTAAPALILALGKPSRLAGSPLVLILLFVALYLALAALVRYLFCRFAPFAPVPEDGSGGAAVL